MTTDLQLAAAADALATAAQRLGAASTDPHVALAKLAVKVATAAAVLEVSPSTVRRLVDAGELVAVKDGPWRGWRVTTASLTEYAERLHRRGTATSPGLRLVDVA